MAAQFCAGINWHSNDPLYRFLLFVRDYILLFVGIPAIGGWVLITWWYLSKPLRYLDEIVDASRKLASPSEEPIELSAALAATANEMNLVRERALRDARAARDAEQRKNDLIVYLAHDLKTPLTSVIGYLTLLRDETELSTGLRAKYTGIALAKAERLEELINEFFDITRFSLTHLTLERETVNLTRMLEQITYEFNPALAGRSLTWDNRLEPGVELVCDPEKLERVFDNLLRNAVGYSYEGTAIEVTLERRGAHAVVRVKNRGRTIAPEKLERIFEQFFRLDSSRGSATGGAGLGLAIAKEIVVLHGGTITAESADESVCFTVTLPGAV
ncbi:HAMP domain-containing histidine kinase [Clostridiales bacterium BX7]|uniref:histidine kinase n=2 Tax=Feifania hominis TaxID=2763660 RepID=A0A926DF49_9FIRM|nr:HAMP domain-containing histidine kinase [Feifania hominis]